MATAPATRFCARLHSSSGASIRSSDVFGRCGGEELIVILPETARDRAVETAERPPDGDARCAPIMDGELGVFVGVGVGVAGDRGP
jgi:diguanylate cyclase (GGDEF)-like protein